MSEYTNWDVNKRLAEAGFDVPADGLKFTDTGEHLGRYRSDTLLSWLLDKGVGVYIDKKNGVDYVYPYGADAESVTAPALPDALAEVVMVVLGTES